MIKYYKEEFKKVLIKILIETFAVIGGCYTAFEILITLFPNQIDIFEIFLKGSIIISFLIGICNNIPKRKFRYTIKNKDVGITVFIGDMFKEKGAKIIPTNTTFDTKMEGEFISSKSIQGQYQCMYYMNNLSALDILMEKELEKEKRYEVLQRTDSKNKRYPIGTTIKLNNNKSRFYFLAIADVNEVGKPCSNFENIQIALEHLWNYILEKGHMEPIVIPIIGSGRTGINESRQKIIKEIIFSFIAHTIEKKISDELIICIHPNDIKNIDLEELKQYLDYICKFYYENDNKTISGKPIEEELKTF